MRREVKKVPTENDGDMYGYDPYDIYDNNEGSLGAVTGQKAHRNRSIDWCHCREQFQEHYPEVKRILYYTDQPQQTAAFIADAEKILKLPLKKRAKLYRTNQKGVLYCQLSDWWATKVRRNLFTILLRASYNYSLKTRNFWAHAKKHQYLSRTNAAFRHFMAGNTTYRSSNYFYGWVDCFSYITRDELKERLVKDAHRKREKICPARK